MIETIRTDNSMYLVCSDLEGIYTPEIWINVAEITGIEELRLTTRDISDYDVLMKKRLAILAEHNLKLDDIQAVIAKMKPVEGALDFLTWLRNLVPLVIVSDTYVEFAGPLMDKLATPPFSATRFPLTATVQSETISCASKTVKKRSPGPCKH